MDIKLTRAYVDEFDAIIQAKMKIQLGEVNFYEEYLGATLADLGKPLTTIHLYSGDTICAVIKFETFEAKMDAFRKAQSTAGIFKSN